LREQRQAEAGKQQNCPPQQARRHVAPQRRI
jgi:hypothetical protein